MRTALMGAVAALALAQPAAADTVTDWWEFANKISPLYAPGSPEQKRAVSRASLAMFVATGSFFLGQMDEIPRSLHGPHVWVLALAPLAALVFWMIRTRPRRRTRLRTAPAAP